MIGQAGVDTASGETGLDDLRIATPGTILGEDLLASKHLETQDDDWRLSW
jgi:hypothetical protein